MLRHLIYSATALVFSFPEFAYAQQKTIDDPLVRARTELQMIQEFADGYCKIVEQKGSATHTEGKLEAEVGLDSFLKRFANVKGGGVADYKSDKWEGPIRESLERMSKSNQDCRMELWKDLRRILSSSAGAPFTVARLKKGLNASIVGMTFNPGFDHIFFQILVRNVSANPMQVATISQGVSAIANNGARYISGPGSVVGVASCRANPANCQRAVQIGQVAWTSLDPEEDVRFTVEIYQQRTGGGNGSGPMDTLLSLNIPLLLSVNGPAQAEEVNVGFSQVRLLDS